jgi:hypothetical protein
MTKQKVDMGRTVRCPRCKYENLAIDIWCERCGTPVDWQGTSSPATSNGNGHGRPTRNGNGRHGGLAALAGGLPWLKNNSAVATPAAAPPVAAPPVAAPPAAAPPVAAAPVAIPTPAQPEIKEPEVITPAAATSSARVFCPECGQSNEATNEFCPRCGHVIAPAATLGASGGVRKQASLPKVARRRPARKPIRIPSFQLPRLKLPQFRLPKTSAPRLRIPRLPVAAWAVAAVVLVLLIAPLAYVLSPTARHLSATRTSPRPVLTKTGTPVTAQTSAVAAAVPGVEAKTGLKYSSGTCPSSSPCLRLLGQTTGLNAAAIQFSTAGTGGRQCAGYVYRDAAGWHFVNATCGLPGQLSPLVGSLATVHVPGQCANVRDAAGLQGGIVACLNDGSSVHVDGGPNYADGKLWWHLEKNGWMAHDFLVSA